MESSSPAASDLPRTPTQTQPGFERPSNANAPNTTEIQYVTSHLRRAHTVAQGRNMGEKTSTGFRTAKERMATSFLRVKDSHELLRKRSSKRLDAFPPPRDTLAGAREPNHFTVGNVGQNGKIFLRPIRNPSRQESCPPPLAPINQSGEEYLHPYAHRSHAENDPSRWSNSQLSELRPELIPEESCEDGESVHTESSRSGYHNSRSRPRQRAHSFSTISDQRSASRVGQYGEFHLFVDRPDDRPKSADGSLRPALETPIPRYRMDMPRLNVGTTPLQSSIYSRTSTSDNFRASRFLRDNWDAAPMLDMYSDPARPSFAASMFSGAAAIELTQSSSTAGNPVFYDLKEPIEPTIFETLVAEMDDESVVRYVPGSKDISAATPARIVAQISSESFMDYELVSDFFLTFRSYLSTGSLLALLLARLQWAINRLQDDGRIIRIRTFAALRHWILNYFVDDFIPDYDLRVRFCDTINTLYDNVKARNGGGMSDLKILIDLKRCWYGKCSAYWEFSDQHIAYQSPDHIIEPGGDTQPDLNNLDENQLNIVRTTSSQVSERERGKRPHITHHDRTNSAATAKSMPVSAESDPSVQPTSCSLRPKSPKRLSMPYAGTKAPHPVPLIPAHQLCPSLDVPASSPVISRRFPFHTHAHKRSGSFSDSVRDGRAPLPLLKIDNQGTFPTQAALNLGGLIRGELFAPAESYMTMMAPPSPPLPSPTGMPGMGQRSNSDMTSKPPSSSSGVKTIIGSIRRALNGRHGGHSVSSRHPGGQFGPSSRGKTSAMPTNVAFGSDAYRDRKATAAAKKPARIDVLCDMSFRLYHNAASDPAQPREGESFQISSAPQGKHSQRGSNQSATSNLHNTALNRVRTKSQFTGGSQSIVIVDDTGMGNPMMSGAIPGPSMGLEHSPRFLDAEHSLITPRASSFRSVSQRSTVAADEYSLPIFYDDGESKSVRRSSQFLRPPRLSAIRRSTSVERGSGSWKGTSPSLRLRKYASFQSGISKHFGIAGKESDADRQSQENMERNAGPMLRRRPGGDLRQMRNDPVLPKRTSSGSYAYDTTDGSSIAESTATRFRDNASRPQTSLVPPNPRLSLIQTHSSQNMRGSFEAAIARFAQIPDDDDGGIESTLLKLEGKWDVPETPTGPSHEQAAQTPGSARERELFYQGHHQRHQSAAGDHLTYSQVRSRLVPRRPYSDSIAESEDSFSSIPLLERGLSDESMKTPAMHRTTSHPVVPPRLHLSDASHRDVSDVGSSHPSIDIVKETDSIKRIPRGSTLPVSVPRPLRTRSARRSGLSSEISVDLIESQEAMEQHRLSFDTRSLGRSSLGIPPHPLAHPPSPPMTIQHPRSVESCATPLNPVLYQSQPLTPDPSPRNRNAEQAHARTIAMQQASGDILSRSEKDRQRQEPQTAPSGPDHVPFVLSCESQILAQQLTLLEMAALSEVDWRDLVDMKWSSGSPATVSWVQFLLEEERRGIDMVVGRFNLMVKWVLSEIILTCDIHERARTMVKFIHTAAHARRMCNYATMLQIAIALSSTDCSRLQSTWACVPPSDRRLLKDMELLIQPVRNFHDLRLEMETANAQEGCIPFVGLYVHDLTYNAQKPAQVAARDGEPLINFERYRTTAKIVKNLLRLIDASTKYKFEPVQGIIERCLWIASLSEEEIQTRSKQLA
ncbi:Guanine nucleotide exchange factor lte1 [Aspergillus melleus]|uniref:Guanine nucleotide exchange factor lte1 n=1 Tax=Aspergillus melleus TaxID=138277 RepID=A0ACC3ALU2_9EURO|nr:Guanine nucleotide exchange factor lte1 [Aspergillus melleus]